ncbi:MAG: hypothetical protein H7070_06155 [Saprospiraceae bacterium]|nr:hypothetical protein [Pyrinomonadaceae bacterium]
MKNIMKVLLVAALFCSSAFAEGDMGNGGLWGGDDTTTSLEGDMGNGGKTCEEGKTCVTDPDDDSMLEIIQDYLASLIG